MRITILTLFPEMFAGFLGASIIKRAIAKGVVSIDCVQIRDFTTDKYGRTDSPPVGGGAGLIERCQPIVAALKSVRSPASHVVLFSPRGTTYTQQKAREYASREHLILIAGHYEGIDERVNSYVDELLSVGDYVLTGGELPAMTVADSVTRLLDGAISPESLQDESFDSPLLEYPQYAEPYDFEGQKIPDILYSGNHEAIAKWRRKEALRLTKALRPDLFERFSPDEKDLRLLKELEAGDTPSWEKEAIDKGHKFIKK